MTEIMTTACFRGDVALAVVQEAARDDLIRNGADPASIRFDDPEKDYSLESRGKDLWWLYAYGSAPEEK